MATITQPLLGPFPGIAALLPVAGSVLLLSQPAQGWVGKLLSCKTLVWIGALSYSLYLWHWPVLAFLRYYTGAELLSIEFSLLFVLLTLMLSIASYYGVERVFRTKRTNKKQALGWVLLATSVLGTSQAMAKVNAVFTPEQLPIEYRRYADPETICHGKIIGDCLKGDLTSDREVLVLGDSHAAMLNHFFDYLGKELGFKARIITASSCVTIPGFDYQRIAEWAHEPCLAQIEQAKLYTNKAEIIFLAAFWSWHMESREFNQALTDFLSNEEYQAQKYIISQEPLLNRDPMRNQRFTYFGIGTKAGLDKDYLRTNQILQELALATNKTTYLVLDRLDIFKQPPIWQGHLVYYDEHHLNEVGALEYAKQALPIISQEVINAN